MSPRVLPANVATAAVAPGYRVGYAVEVGLASPVRVTDCPTGVTIGGHAFSYGFLQLGDTVYDAHPALSVLLSNADNALSAVDTADLGLGVLIGTPVTVWEVMWLPATGAQLGEVTLLGSSVVVAPLFDEAGAQLTCQGTSEIAAGMVGRVCSRACMFVFKGARCGYAGAATSCAHTFNTCTALGNAARYGGFQTMPTLGTRLSYFVTSYVPGSFRFGTVLAQTVASQQTSPAAPRVRPMFHRAPAVHEAVMVGGKPIPVPGRGGPRIRGVNGG